MYIAAHGELALLLRIETLTTFASGEGHPQSIHAPPDPLITVIIKLSMMPYT